MCLASSPALVLLDIENVDVEVSNVWELAFVEKTQVNPFGCATVWDWPAALPPTFVHNDGEISYGTPFKVRFWPMMLPGQPVPSP